MIVRSCSKPEVILTPSLFDLHIELPELLYRRVIEVDERLSAHGEVVRRLAMARVGNALAPPGQAVLTYFRHARDGFSLGAAG